MRLNVYLQKAGVGSRREAERMVAAGRVMVNGKVASVTTPVEESDNVMVDGKPLSPATKELPRLFMLYKPLDTLVTNHDKQGRDIIFDLPVFRQPHLPRLMAVGRLDMNSEGLLLLSSDGPLAQAMMSPENALERTYKIRVHGKLTNEQMAKIGKGVTVKGVKYRGAKIVEDTSSSGKNTWYKIVLTEGKNREVRKLMEHFGCVVNRLIRLQYGPIQLGVLKKGELKEVPANQVKKLIETLRQKGARV